jgi:hypothetical protein
MLVFLAYFSTLKVEVTCSCETSVDFQRTTRRYIREDRTFQILILPVVTPAFQYSLMCFQRKINIFTKFV